MSFFKKAALSTAISITSISVLAEPADFRLHHTYGGIKTYMNFDNSVAIIEVPTNKAEIKFSVGSEQGKDYKDNRLFERLSLENHYAKALQNNLYMGFNGQFFNHAIYPTPLSFSTKVNGDILQSGQREPEKDKRLLLLYKGYPMIYSGGQYNMERFIKVHSVTDAIIGVNPFDRDVKEEFHWKKIKGRFSIGCIPYKERSNLAICKKLLFIVANRQSNKFITEELRSWGVKDRNMLQMDGSVSSQAYSGRFFMNNVKFKMGGSRLLPNALLLYKK